MPARDAELLRVAAAMFHERGYAATAISDIGSALGIKKGSVYHYIDSKEDLLFRICKSVHDDAEPVLEAVEAMDGDALERLELYVRETAASNARNVTKIAVYYNEFGRLTPSRRADIEREQGRHETLVVGLIEDGKRDGLVVTNVATHVMAANLLAQVVWLYTWFREGKGLEPDELGRAIAGLALQGIATRRPARRRAVRPPSRAVDV
jgi:AcrR family transcriptional regulator